MWERLLIGQNVELYFCLEDYYNFSCQQTLINTSFLIRKHTSFLMCTGYSYLRLLPVFKTSILGRIKGTMHGNFRAGFQRFGTRGIVPTIFRKSQHRKRSRSQDKASWMFEIRDQRNQWWGRSIAKEGMSELRISWRQHWVSGTTRSIASKQWMESSQNTEIS